MNWLKWLSYWYHRRHVLMTVVAANGKSQHRCVRCGVTR